VHAFSADGSQVFVLDGYGLTRVGLERGATKTVDGVTGTALCRAGSLIAVRSEYGATRPVRVGELSRPTRAKPELFKMVPHPDGEHLLRATTTRLEVLSLEGARVGELAIQCPHPRACELGRALPLTDGTLPDEVTIDDGGMLAVFSHREGALVRVRLPDVRAALTPSGPRHIEGVRIDVPSPIGPCHLGVASGNVMLCAHVPSTDTSHALLLLADDRVRELRRSSLGLFAFDGAAFASQPAPDTVLVERLDGGEDRWTIPAGCLGAGEVMLDRTRLLFLPPSRESILDLRTGRGIDRRLPAAELPARIAARAFLARANERGRRHDVVFDLASLRTLGSRELCPQFRWSGGDQSLFAALLIGHFIAEMLEHWDPASMQLVSVLTTTGEDELVQGLALLDALGVPLLGALPFCASAFQQAVGVRRPFKPPTTTQHSRIFAAGVGHRFLRAVLAMASGRTWDAADTANELDLDALPQLGRSDAPVSVFGKDLRNALAWILVETLEARAWHTLFAWLVVDPNPYADANTYNASAPAVRLCDLHPEAKPALREACTDAARSGDPEKARRAVSLLRAIDAPP
jgi:hypothetical protein